MAKATERPEQTEREEIIGKHVRRLDGESKVDGTIEYTDDIEFNGYYVELVRSNVVHGELTNVEKTDAEAHPGVHAVITGGDLADADWVSPFIGPAFRDQPLLAVDRVRYLGEPVAAVLANSPEAAEAGAGKVRIQCDRLSVVDDVSTARADDAPRLHEHGDVSAVFDDLSSVKMGDEPNVAYTYTFDEGDVDAGFDEADVVLEGSYSTPMIQHTHLEPFVTVAEYDPGTDSFRIVTGTQTPHFVKQEVARIFDLPNAKVEVAVPQMGGSYGAKTYARMEPLAAALSRAVRAPVKLRQSASENFDTAVRDGTETSVKTGVTSDGEIVAQEVKVIWDSGAYADISPRKAKKAGYTAVGAYDIPNVSIVSSCTYTNKPPGVAYRGFGVAQTAWAVESHLDDVATELGIDPYELRLRNIVQDEGTYNGSNIGTTGASACLKAVAEDVDWLDSPIEQRDEDHLVRGRGMSVTLKATITPSTAEAIVLLDSDGSVTVITGATKVGQGVQTTFAQIAADEFGIPLERVEIMDPNTDIAPFNTSTTSSRTTYHVGNAIIRAINDIKGQLVEFVAEKNGLDPSSLTFEDGTVVGADGVKTSAAEIIRGRFPGGGGTVIGKGYFTTKKSPGKLESEQPGREDTWKAAEADSVKLESQYQSAFWMSGATVVDVTVDMRTGSYTIDRWANATDAGKAIDPERVRGQILGAATQGLGHVRSEEMIFEGGQQVNKSLLDYKVPVIEDVPNESSELIIESNDPGGPHGAKGVGEANTVTVPPAVGNAIADATGARVTSLPITPEKVLRELSEEDE